MRPDPIYVDMALWRARRARVERRRRAVHIIAALGLGLTSGLVLSYALYAVVTWAR